MGATIIDVGIYNLLKRPAAGWRRIPANMVSVSAGLTFNCFANWLLVLHPARKRTAVSEPSIDGGSVRFTCGPK